jgi:DNA-binding transcriptional regulator GbsR (MarR family)
MGWSERSAGLYLGALFIADTVFSIGSVRETARRLSLSASTVSGALRRLETDLAMKLVERASGELATLLASAKVKKGLQPILAGMRALSALTKEPPAPDDYAQWAARLPRKIATIERFLEVADLSENRTSTAPSGAVFSYHPFRSLRR